MGFHAERKESDKSRANVAIRGRVRDHEENQEGGGRGKKPRQVETLAKEVSPLAPVQGFGFQYYVTNVSNDNQAHLWHALLVRVQKLMESKMNGSSFETRNHYGFLLEKIEDVRNWK